MSDGCKTTVTNVGGILSFEKRSPGNLLAASTHSSVGHLADPNSGLALEVSYTTVATQLLGNSNLYVVFVLSIVFLVVALYTGLRSLGFHFCCQLFTRWDSALLNACHTFVASIFIGHA